MTQIPDAEKLIGNYLRTYPGLDTRVVGEPPPQELIDSPWIMLTQLDAQNEADLTPDYLITYFLQLDCYAGATGGQPEAVSLGRKTREAMAALHRSGTLLGGTAVVSGVRFTSHARIPDTSLEPSRERVVIDTEVTMHTK